MYPFVYILPDGLQATNEFWRWFLGLRDPTTQRRIAQRLDRLALGNHGDFKVIDRNLYELRLHHGPAGGDKWSQFRDIALARQLRDKETI